MRRLKVRKSFIFKSFAGLSYTLSVICIAAGITGISSANSNNFESKNTSNVNINKTISTEDLMASVKKVTVKIEQENKARREKELMLQKQKKEKEMLKAAQTLATTAPKNKIQQYAHDLVVGKYGWNESDFSSLVKLWNRESGWNPKSYSKSGACGIPQALPCSKIAAKYGSNTWENQVKWGLSYIKGKYGTPSKAWASFQTNGWY